MAKSNGRASVQSFSRCGIWHLNMHVTLRVSHQVDLNAPIWLITNITQSALVMLMHKLFRPVLHAQPSTTCKGLSKHYSDHKDKHQQTHMIGSTTSTTVITEMSINRHT